MEELKFYIMTECVRGSGLLEILTTLDDVTLPTPANFE